MNKISSWIKAARLRTLPLALSCVVIAAFIAQYYDSFDWHIFIWAAATTILLQVLANFANDYGDTQNGADNQDRIGPDRMVQSGQITTRQIKNGIILSIILTIASGMMLLYKSFGSELFSSGAIILFILGLVSIIAAIKYTAGKNPYGYNAFGDVSVFLFFGILGVLGNIYLYTHQLVMWDLLPAISIGAFSVAVLNLNNMRDRLEDQKVGKNTIPTYLGQSKAKVYHIILLATGIISACSYSIQTIITPYSFVYFLAFVILLIHALKVMRVENAIDFDPELKKVALSTFLFSILFGIGLIF